MKHVFLKSLIIFLVVTPSAFGQLLIEEGKVVLPVSPGKTINGRITIHNTSKTKPEKVKVYWEDFEYVSPFDGSKKFYTAGTTDNSASEWFFFTPREFVLQPLGKHYVNYSLKPPADVENGYYGVLFFESVAKKPQGNVGVSIVSRVGSLIFLEAENKVKSAKVENISVESATLRGEFLNTGGVVLLPEGIYYILDTQDNVVERGEVKKYYLPPQGKTGFEIKLPSGLNPGLYTMVLTFDLGEGDSVVKEISFAIKKDASIRVQSVKD